MYKYLLFILSFVKSESFIVNKKIAIVTGGTRGIVKGISESLAEKNFDLLLTYNTDKKAAIETSSYLKDKYMCDVKLVAGDISLSSTRDKIFNSFDKNFKDRELGALIHNAGQFIGITSSNDKNLVASFGQDADSIINENGVPDFEISHYYQRMYGDAFIDLCERASIRMRYCGGSLVGISSPGCSLQYKPQPGYFLPGTGKAIMEYAMRSFALKYAKNNINCNVVIPGVTETDAWDRIGEVRKISGKDIIQSMSSKISPNGSMKAKEVGDGVAFLCSPVGRHITGVSLPFDNGVHLKA